MQNLSIHHTCFWKVSDDVKSIMRPKLRGFGTCIKTLEFRGRVGGSEILGEF